ncbi:MAG: hypothetical protein AAF915_01995 [Cyanobacteria bacterium P01_D01_bin.50]
MGILARITANKSSSNETQKPLSGESHGINKDAALAATSDYVINPNNPGNWASIRTAPILQQPRYFSKPEADGLKRLATEKAEGARQSQRAYKSLRKIEHSDAVVHKYHRRYESTVADAELTKLKSNTKLAKHLHAQRPEYFRMGAGIDRSEKSGDRRISELKAKVKEKF